MGDKYLGYVEDKLFILNSSGDIIKKLDIRVKKMSNLNHVITFHRDSSYYFIGSHALWISNKQGVKFIDMNTLDEVESNLEQFFSTFYSFTLSGFPYILDVKLYHLNQYRIRTLNHDNQLVTRLIGKAIICEIFNMTWRTSGYKTLPTNFKSIVKTLVLLNRRNVFGNFRIPFDILHIILTMVLDYETNFICESLRPDKKFKKQKTLFSFFSKQ
jgi:hypothetical protein